MSKLNSVLKINLNEASDTIETPLVYEFKLKNLLKDIPKKRDAAIAKGIKCWENYEVSLEAAARYKTMICLLVHKHCQVIYGGITNEQKRKGVYKLKDFANDIGMNSNTLQHWYESFRNINLRMHAATPENEDWINPTTDQRKIIRSINKDVNRDTPMSELLRKVNKQKRINELDFRLQRHLENIVGLQNFLVNKEGSYFDSDIVDNTTKCLKKCLLYLGGN